MSAEPNIRELQDGPDMLPVQRPASPSSWPSIVRNGALLVIVFFAVMAAVHFIRILALWG